MTVSLKSSIAFDVACACTPNLMQNPGQFVVSTAKQAIGGDDMKIRR